MSKVANAMKEDLSWEKMKEQVIDVYMKYYTEKEITDMLAFYDSESGKSIIEKMPKVTHESMLITQTLLKDFMPKIQVLSQELQAEIETERCKKEKADSPEGSAEISCDS
jgi:hypothetical protein